MGTTISSNESVTLIDKIRNLCTVNSSTTDTSLCLIHDFAKNQKKLFDSLVLQNKLPFKELTQHPDFSSG